MIGMMKAQETAYYRGELFHEGSDKLLLIDEERERFVRDDTHMTHKNAGLLMYKILLNRMNEANL